MTRPTASATPAASVPPTAPGGSTASASVSETPPTPTSLPRLLTISLGLAATGVVLWFMRDLSDILTPVFLALNLMIAAHPIFLWLTGHRVPRVLSSIITGLTTILVLVLFFWALGWAGAQLVYELPNYSDQLTELYNQVIRQLSRLGISQTQITEQLKSINPTSVLGVVQGVLTGAQGIFSLLSVVVCVILFCVMDLMGLGKRLTIVDRLHPNFGQSLRAFSKGVRGYWLVSTFFGIIVAVLDSIALALIGVPLAMAWGVLAFLTNYIPNIGFFIGLVPPALLGLLVGGPMKGLLVVVVYCVLNFVIQSLIQPKFAGDAVGVTPTVSFISLLFWAWLLGPMGALLALPFTLLVKAIFVDGDPDARWFNALIASDPDTALAPTPQAAALGDDADDDHDADPRVVQPPAARADLG
ncbi:AI-2E family transporter [Arsenicicoccus piscis]|uniref:AI-2E family transporter n=1 Tax=Arsenicicoccus piscis TaxID=673954 RepID=UPI0024E0D7D6|nr:AI-2E family transporter [Arsenicicoccus piscis]